MIKKKKKNLKILSKDHKETPVSSEHCRKSANFVKGLQNNFIFVKDCEKKPQFSSDYHKQTNKKKILSIGQRIATELWYRKLVAMWQMTTINLHL